jgi:hypothetical protein
MEKYNFNPYSDLEKLFNYWGKNLENGVYEVIMQLKLNNIIKIKNESLSFLNFSHTTIHNDKKIKDFIKLQFNVSELEYININYDTDNKIYNYADIEKIKNKIDHKIDIIMISLISENFVKKIKRIDYEKYYTTQLFNSVLFSLTNQKINGCFISISFTFLTDAIIDILTIIKKYYKYIYLTCYNTSRKITTTTKIIASGFLGISEIELKELINISNKISNKLKQYDNYDNINVERFIHKLIKNNNNESFIKKIIKFSIEKNNLTMYNNKIWQDLILFIKKNKHLEYKIKNFIYTIQLKYFFWWLIKYQIKI